MFIFYYINRYNRNPTARTFRCCFGHICSFSFMKCATSCNNCKPDNSEFMTVEVLKDIKIETEIESRIDEALNENFDVTTDSDDLETSSTYSSTSSPTHPTLETCSITYFAGYLAKKYIDNYKCEDCRLKLVTPDDLEDDHQLLILNKEYDYISHSKGLKLPSKLLIQVTKICLDVFTEMFPQIKTEKEILKKLITTASHRIKNKLSCLNHSCQTHFNYLIELLFRTKIYKQCKWINGNSSKKRELQNADKLKIFKNK